MYTKKENRITDRITHPFVAHYKNKTFIGVNVSKTGIGIQTISTQQVDYTFHKGQRLDNITIEIEGVTIYFSSLNVAWAEVNDHGLVYGLCAESIVPQEQEKLNQMCDKLAPEFSL